MTNYVALADLKTALRINDTDDDYLLNLAIGAASRAIDTATHRTFTIASGSAVARAYTADMDSRYIVTVDDFMTTDDLAIEVDWDEDGVYEEDVTASGALFLLPLNAAFAERPWTKIQVAFPLPTHVGGVQVTAKWGWTAVPTTIEHATLIQAARFFKRRDAPFGVAGSPEMGNELRLLNKLDPDVALMVNDYRKWWGAV